ncbi:MAG TPA: hypothetical protein VM689_01420 [Aliidongia sp.]|nr:hypothetical protein [Aliidongia sp.]
MTINAACCFLKSGNTWSSEHNGSAELKAADGKHAEQLAYKEAKEKSGASKIFLIKQNAFPCVKCTLYFLEETVKNGYSFIFNCESNDGLYARECGFLSKPFHNDPDNPNLTEAQLRGFLYFQNGNLSAKKKLFKIDKEKAVITSSYCAGSGQDAPKDIRPKELINLPGASSPQGV